MQITVKNEIVKHNLELLKDLLHRSKSKKCKAWIETSTGKIRASVPKRNEQAHTWKAVRICLVNNLESEPAALVIEEDTAVANLFDLHDWTVHARRSVLATVHIINSEITSQWQDKNISDFLEDFASAQILFMPNRNLYEHSIILEAWLDGDRVQAEHALEGALKGTYLFRKDHFASTLEEELYLRFGKPVCCVTLTYLDENGIVRDKTLVGKEEGILIYDDDPLLLEERYRSIEEVMGSIVTSLCHPLIDKFKKAE